jgi:hypothetical protein
LRRLHFATFALVLAGCSPTGASLADRRSIAEAREIGAPEDCVTITNIRNTRVRDDRTIDFFLRDGTVYRNRLPHSCPGLGLEERFSYATSLSRLCSVDTVTVLLSAPAMRGATCGLGQFQRVELPAR